MLTERKLTERELESREVVLRGLLDNKQNLVKKYGKDAEKVMYGIATKKAKSKVESMNKEKIKELIVQSLTKEAAVTSVEDVIDPADYGLIGAGYLAGFGKKHSLNADQLEELGRKIVKQLYKGDFKAAKAKFIKEDNDPSGADLEGDPNEYVVGEGHGLGQEDLDILKRLLKVGEGDFLQPAEARVLKFLIKSNILQDKTKDLSKDKIEEENISLDEVGYNDGEQAVAMHFNQDVVGINNESDFKQYKKGFIKAVVDETQSYTLEENADQDNAVYELRNIVDQIEELGDEARQIVRQNFPNEMSRMEGYGVFNLAYSNNRYDTTLGSEVDRLEGGDYDDLDDEDYPMEEGKKKKMKLPSGLVNYMDFTKSVAEKLTKKHKVGDFVDDFQKSDAKQFKGKSDKKKKEMAVAAYLAKQND